MSSTKFKPLNWPLVVYLLTLLLEISSECCGARELKTNSTFRASVSNQIERELEFNLSAKRVLGNSHGQVLRRRKFPAQTKLAGTGSAKVHALLVALRLNETIAPTRRQRAVALVHRSERLNSVQSIENASKRSAENDDGDDNDDDDDENEDNEDEATTINSNESGANENDELERLDGDEFLIYAPPEYLDTIGQFALPSMSNGTGEPIKSGVESGEPGGSYADEALTGDGVQNNKNNNNNNNNDSETRPSEAPGGSINKPLDVIKSEIKLRPGSRANARLSANIEHRDRQQQSGDSAQTTTFGRNLSSSTAAMFANQNDNIIHSSDKGSASVVRSRPRSQSVGGEQSLQTRRFRLQDGGTNGSSTAEGGTPLEQQQQQLKSMPFCLGHRESKSSYVWTCQGAQLKRAPTDLSPRPTSLRLANTGLESLRLKSLESYGETLRDFSIENAPKLSSVDENSFANLTNLRVVYIIHAPRLVSFDYAIAGQHPDLAIIRIQQTGLKRWPNLAKFNQEKVLISVDLDNNRIETLGSAPINIRAELVNLEFNQLTRIEEHTFNGSEIGALSLSGNRLLASIHPNAFANLRSLTKLDLSSTSVVHLPTAGLQQLRVLQIRDNYHLREIPSIYVFPMLEEAHLTYAYHCCSFKYPQTHDPSAYEEHIRSQNEINEMCARRQQQHHEQRHQLKTRRHLISGKRIFSNLLEQPVEQSTQTTTTTQNPDFEGSFFDASPNAATHDESIKSKEQSSEQQQQQQQQQQHNVPNHQEEEEHTNGAPSHVDKSTSTTSDIFSSSNKKLLLSQQNIECGELVLKQTGHQNITCTPEPDAFNPCEDIMGYSVLRVAVWFVVACSVFGNMSVIIVLLGIFRRLSVPKFLQLNLAIGDLFMGVYLAMLAGADLTTVGVYFNYAMDWQHGLGCQLAGAASLFASQLSIFTLSVITFERYYTITYSIDLNMRLQLGWAARIMLFGWVYAFASAMLPIFANINSYSRTSICLPVRTAYKWDRVFIFVLLAVDSSAFLIIFICYLRMYLLISRQKTDATLKERTIATRMALLVFTDFICWAPIIFFGATAIFGHPLISVTNSKILIVFFYPLNSMANPFLYVLPTRQYRRDLNYVVSRWQHWRRNLFKSQEEKDYSFNNNNPYNGAMNKYQQPVCNAAHLGAVAAVTGVASHLHHYKLQMNYMDADLAAGHRQFEQFELVAAANRHHRHVHQLRKPCQVNEPRADALNEAGAEHTIECKSRCRHHKARSVGRFGRKEHQEKRPDQCKQYIRIIRHQILPDKCGSAHGVGSVRSLSPSARFAASRQQVDAAQPMQAKNISSSRSPVHERVQLGKLIDDHERESNLLLDDIGDCSELLVAQNSPDEDDESTQNDRDNASKLVHLSGLNLSSGEQEKQSNINAANTTEQAATLTCSMDNCHLTIVSSQCSRKRHTHGKNRHNKSDNHLQETTNKCTCKREKSPRGDQNKSDLIRRGRKMKHSNGVPRVCQVTSAPTSSSQPEEMTTTTTNTTATTSNVTNEFELSTTTSSCGMLANISLAHETQERSHNKLVRLCEHMDTLSLPKRARRCTSSDRSNSSSKSCLIKVDQCSKCCNKSKGQVRGASSNHQDNLSTGEIHRHGKTATNSIEVVYESLNQSKRLHERTATDSMSGERCSSERCRSRHRHRHRHHGHRRSRSHNHHEHRGHHHHRHHHHTDRSCSRSSTNNERHKLVVVDKCFSERKHSFSSSVFDERQTIGQRSSNSTTTTTLVATDSFKHRPNVDQTTEHQQQQQQQDSQAAVEQSGGDFVIIEKSAKLNSFFCVDDNTIGGGPRAIILKQTGSHDCVSASANQKKTKRTTSTSIKSDSN